jgi:hypothetical protein
MNNPHIDKRRLFLQPYVNTIVTVEGWCQHHGYVPTPIGRPFSLPQSFFLCPLDSY